VDSKFGQAGNDGRDAALLESIQVQSESHGINIWFVHAPFAAEYSISSPSQANVDQGVEVALACVDGCAFLGGSGVVTHSSEYLEESESPRERLPRAKEALARIVEHAAPLGIQIAVENLPPQCLGGRSFELLELIEPYGRDEVGFCLDTGHAYLRGGEGATLVEAAAPNVITTHNDGEDD